MMTKVSGMKPSGNYIPGVLLSDCDRYKFHVVELKRWLKCRGPAKTTGKREYLVKQKATTTIDNIIPATLLRLALTTLQECLLTKVKRGTAVLL